MNSAWLPFPSSCWCLALKFFCLGPVASLFLSIWLTNTSFLKVVDLDWDIQDTGGQCSQPEGFTFLFLHICQDTDRHGVLSSVIIFRLHAHHLRVELFARLISFESCKCVLKCTSHAPGTRTLLQPIFTLVELATPAAISPSAMWRFPTSRVCWWLCFGWACPFPLLHTSQGGPSPP